MVRAIPKDPGISGDDPLPPETPGPPVDVPADPPAGPLSDNEPREPHADELPVEKAKPGWQAPPTPRERPPFKCMHMGRIPAGINIWQYEIGTEWICSCGQVFTVEYNAGGKKVLRMQEKVVEVELPSGADDQLTVNPVVETPVEEPPIEALPAEEWPVDETREAEEPING